MLQEVWVDLHWIQELELTLGPRLHLDESFSLRGQFSVGWVQVPLRRVVLVAKARLVVKLVMCVVDGVLRTAVHTHCKLGFHGFLEGRAFADEGLVAQSVQDAG